MINPDFETLLQEARDQERDRLLDELMLWVKQNNTIYKDADGDKLPAIITGRIMNKISSLRSHTSVQS